MAEPRIGDRRAVERREQLPRRDDATVGEPQLLRDAAEAAAEDTDPIGDIRGSSDYKREMVKVWVRRMVQKAASAASV